MRRDDYKLTSGTTFLMFFRCISERSEDKNTIGDIFLSGEVNRDQRSTPNDLAELVEVISSFLVYTH